MRALVVYESMYGNTHQVADAIAAGLDGFDPDVISLHDATPDRLAATDLVVVGGPTHVHSLTRESTRRAAVEAAGEPGSHLRMDPDSEGDGLREWFDRLPPTAVPTAAAAFDTRMPGPAALTGRASKGIAKRLRKLGFVLVAGPASFLVTKQNTLSDDEIAHARAWGATLARGLASLRTDN